MPKFKVKTQSTFEHIYFVDAETSKLAVEQVLDSENIPEFYQRHMGEVAIESKEISSFDEEERQIYEEGFV